MARYILSKLGRMVRIGDGEGRGGDAFRDPGQASGGGMAGLAPWLGVYGLSVSLSLTLGSYGLEGARFGCMGARVEGLAQF